MGRSPKMSDLLNGIVEAIKLTGSVAGLASGWFLITGQLRKTRPAVSFCRRPFGAGNRACLRIQNTTDREMTIGVRWSPSDVLAVVPSDFAGERAYDARPSIDGLLLSTGSEVFLPVVRQVAGRADPEAIVRIQVAWRSGQWVFARRMRMYVNTAYIHRIASGGVMTAQEGGPTSAQDG
jgi:hypothetical protein